MSFSIHIIFFLFVRRRVLVTQSSTFSSSTSLSSGTDVGIIFRSISTTPNGYCFGAVSGATVDGRWSSLGEGDNLFLFLRPLRNHVWLDDRQVVHGVFIGWTRQFLSVSPARTSADGRRLGICFRWHVNDIVGRSRRHVLGGPFGGVRGAAPPMSVVGLRADVGLRYATAELRRSVSLRAIRAAA